MFNAQLLYINSHKSNELCRLESPVDFNECCDLLWNLSLSLNKEDFLTIEGMNTFFEQKIDGNIRVVFTKADLFGHIFFLNKMNQTSTNTGALDFLKNLCNNPKL